MSLTVTVVLGELAPYEGKKAFLAFEGSREGTAALVEASELATLLLDAQIPIAILNACQSGKQVGPSESSLGSRLVQAGVQQVLAMAYSITVSAAVILMSTLYKELFAGQDLSVAIRQARQELADHKGRLVAFNQEIDLEDWLLPVVYQNQPLHLRPRPFTPEEAADLSRSQGHRYRASKPLYGFVGRDLDILRIERRLLTKGNILLVRGMGGAGKTTLLEYLGTWWQITGLVDQVCYFGYDKRPWTRQQLIVAVAKQLLGEEAYIRNYQSLPLDALQDQLNKHLRAHRHLLILDNFESITGAQFAVQHTLLPEERDELHRLLAALAGAKTLILLGSRSDETWLAKDTFVDNIYDLPGLDAQAATVLTDRILKRFRVEKYRKDEKLGDLVKLLGGFPLALEVVLANLTHQTPSEVLTMLQSGDVSLNVGTSQEKTENILRCIEYSHCNLSLDAQLALLCLSPFTSTVNSNMLEDYSVFLGQQPRLSTLPPGQWSKVLHEAEHWGLLKEDDHIPDLFHLQPILSYFLRTRLRAPEQEETRRAIETAFREAYDQVAKTLYSVLTAENPKEQQWGRIFTSLEYENLVTALNIALVDQVSILNLYSVLSQYLDAIQDHRRALELGQAALNHLQTYAPDHLVGQIGIESVAVMKIIVNQQMHLKQYAASEAMGQKALSLLLQNKYFKTDAVRKMSASIYLQLGGAVREQGEWEKARHYYQQALQITIEYDDGPGQARVYHELGILAERLGDWEEAERCYKEASQIKIKYDDRPQQALTYHQLGKLAQDQRKWREAEYYYRKALPIFIKRHDRYGQAAIAHNLGMMAQEQRKWEEAKRYYQEALHIFIECGLRYEQARPYHQLGVVAQEQGNWEEAERYYKEALQIKIKYSDRPEQAFTYHQLGRVAEEREQWEEAERCYQQALLIFVEYKDRHGQAGVYGQLGILAQDREQWKQASEYAVRALEIFVDIEDSYNSTLAFHQLALYWLKSGDETLPVVVAGIIRSSMEEVVESWRELLEAK